MTTIDFLPSQPSYKEACDVIDYQPLSYWSPLLNKLQNENNLGEGGWQRIKEGSNALFDLNGQFIVKVVPPNWQQQGHAEINADNFLTMPLSLSRPKIITSGEINGWVYLLMTRLSGSCLADIWSILSLVEKKPLVKHVGQFMRELHQLPCTKGGAAIEWSNYIAKLKDSCLERHQRNKLDKTLLEQVIPFVELHIDTLLQQEEQMFVHMDLHPWNLMVDKIEGQWRLTGVVDFGDASFAYNPFFELLTPCCFMAQGQSELYAELLAGYQCLSIAKANELQDVMMATALLRPASDINFVMQQIGEISPRDNWQQVAQQLFPFISADEDK